jgi:propanol-preferring alcohol dehydrogenase
MKCLRLTHPAPVDSKPLSLAEIDPPHPGSHEVRLHVHACGLCHTDLHIVEGELRLPQLPVTPGHQIIGVVDEVGRDVTRFRVGDRLGVPWLYSTCGKCEYCASGRENLCDNARFTGYHANGGYAEHMIVHEDFAYPIPKQFSDVQAAPLLCAGVIGYRALRLSGIRPGQRLGLYGFGASAHITLQIARHQGCEVFVFTRSKQHQELAAELGAAWTGRAEDKTPHPIEGSIIFAPAGQLVPHALRALKKGGTLALAGIHMSPIPEMEYSLLYEERMLRSVANSTRSDVREMLEIAAEIPIHTEVETFPLEETNEALRRMKMSEIRGSGVVVLNEGSRGQTRDRSGSDPGLSPY